MRSEYIARYTYMYMYKENKTTVSAEEHKKRTQKALVKELDDTKVD